MRRQARRPGSYSPPDRNIRFERVAVLNIPSMLDNAGFWSIDLHSGGDLLMCGMDTSGAGLIDISDISEPSFINNVIELPPGYSYQNCRRLVEKNKDELISCSRNSSNSLGGGGGSGFVRTYDISSGTIQTLNTFDANVESPTTSQRYSDLIVDKEKEVAYVNGRTTSIESFDISNMSNIQRITEHISSGLENHGVEIKDDYVIWINYGNASGNIVVTPVSNIGEIGSKVYTPRFYYKSVNQRGFRCLIDGDYLYVTIIETSTSQHFHCGLLIYDISGDLDSELPFVGHCPITTMLGHADPNVNIGNPRERAGDEPNNGLSKLNDFVYLANGHRGVAMIDVSIPSKPVALATHGLSLPANENIKACLAIEKDGETYCIYGSGNSIESVNHKNLYIDKVVR